MIDLRNTVLTGPRVRIVPITMEYDREIFSNFTEEITTYMFPSPAEVIDHTRAFIQEAMAGLEEGSNYQVVVLDKESGEFLGCSGAHRVNTPTPELGIWLKKEAHGRGLGPEIIHTIYNWLEANFSFDFAVYPVDRRNASSVQIAQSLGGVLYEEKKEKNMAGGDLDLLYFKIDPKEVRYTFFYPDQMNVQDGFVEELWPEFMMHDPVADENWVAMFEGNRRSQILAVKEGVPIAAANSIAVCWDGTAEDLPDRGWDWAMESGCRLEGEPDTLIGLQIAVRKGYQGQGLSGEMLKQLKKSAKVRGLKQLFIPVRPTLKKDYPLIPMDDYFRWKRKDGLPFDPWLRVHVRLDGEIIKSCPEAMTIPGSVADWEKWAGMSFPQTGLYTVPGALVPIWVDLEEDNAEYLEPNVWVRHRLS